MGEGRKKKNQMTFEFAAPDFSIGATIKVVGVGGAGCNAVNRMIEDGLDGVEFIAVNTDAQALQACLAPCRIQIGTELTNGLGAGGNPEIGRASAEESVEPLRSALAGADMVFVTCGEGGGTGTGAAPVVAAISRDQRALTVGVVTKPFRVEGGRRHRQATDGIGELRRHVDTLIVIPNQRLMALVPRDLPFRQALRKADDVLYQATKGIADLINIAGDINVDFADVKAVMQERGDALMGTGASSEEEARAVVAAQDAISSPLLEDVSIEGARGVLVNVTGGPDLSLTDVDEAVGVVHEAAGPDANIIFGTVIDESLGGQVRVTVIATGFDRSDLEAANSGRSNWQAASPALDRTIATPPAPVRDAQPEREHGVDPMETTSPDLTVVQGLGPDTETESLLVGVPRTRGVERPAFLRAGREMPDAEDGGRRNVASDDIDIPTFLRRQMD